MIAHDRTQLQAAWDSIAAGYDAYVTPSHMWLANEALRMAGIHPAAQILDVACGSGALSIPAARLGAQVLAVDLSPAMIERLTERARGESLANLESRVMDGYDLQLPSDTFDIVASQFGVMLFEDLPRGLSELVRVTRPGGKVLLVAYGAPGKVEFLTFFIGALQAVVPGFTGLPAEPPPLPFQVADPEVLRQRLADAGLQDTRVETITEQLEFRSSRHMWDWLTNSNPIGAALVADLTANQRAAVQQKLAGMLAERAAGRETAILTNPINIGIGTK